MFYIIPSMNNIDETNFNAYMSRFHLYNIYKCVKYDTLSDDYKKYYYEVRYDGARYGDGYEEEPSNPDIMLRTLFFNIIVSVFKNELYNYYFLSETLSELSDLESRQKLEHIIQKNELTSLSQSTQDAIKKFNLFLKIRYNR